MIGRLKVNRLPPQLSFSQEASPFALLAETYRPGNICPGNIYQRLRLNTIEISTETNIKVSRDYKLRDFRKSLHLLSHNNLRYVTTIKTKLCSLSVFVQKETNSKILISEH